MVCSSTKLVGQMSSSFPLAGRSFSWKLVEVQKNRVNYTACKRNLVLAIPQAADKWKQSQLRAQINFHRLSCLLFPPLGCASRKQPQTCQFLCPWNEFRCLTVTQVYWPIFSHALEVYKRASQKAIPRSPVNEQTCLFSGFIH